MRVQQCPKGVHNMKVTHYPVEDTSVICVLHNIEHDRDDECPMCAREDADET